MGEIKKIESVSIDKLIPYVNNAKIHNEQQLLKIASSIREFGFLSPVLIDKDFNIIAGHGRIMAAKKVDIKEVPCVFIEGLTEGQRKAYILADNKLGELADWDMSLVASELDQLLEMDFDIDLTGFDLDINLEEEKEVVEDDYVESDVKPRAKQGDIYQLGRHRLMCGDSTSPTDVEKLVGGVDIDMVFTDPPYGMNAVSKSGVLKENYKTDIMNDDSNKVAIDTFNLCAEMFPNIKQVWWGANYYTECLPSSECWIVWDKNNGASDQTDCELAWANFRSVVRQFTMASEKTNRVHPTQKPCKLITQVIDRFEKDKKFNNVLDLFGGSGSTLIACEQTNRKAIVMELDPHFIDVIIDRWERLTGQKAVLLNG